MSRHPRIVFPLVLVAVLLSSANSKAQGCRARAIVENQCMWFVLDELGGDRGAARQAERAATSGLVAGCTPGQYQMALFHGTSVTDVVTKRLGGGPVGTNTARAACAAAARASIP